MDKVKLSYLQCDRSKQHRYEPLNYVCIEQSCPTKGLICSMCKSEHQSHEIIPLKILLNHLKDVQGVTDMNGLQSCLERVETHRNLALFQLRTAVQSLSKMFQNIEQQIFDQFTRIKTSLLEEVEINLNLSNFIEKTAENIIQSREQYLMNFSQLANIVKFDGKSKTIKLEAKIFQKTNTYEQKQISFAQLLQGLESYVCEYFKMDNGKRKKIQNSKLNFFVESSEQQFALGDYFDDGLPTCLSAKIPESKEGYTFSPLNKSSSIVISDQSLRAKQSITGQGRFAFVQQNVGKKNQTIAFEVVNLSNWVGFGVGILDVLKKANFHFNYNQNHHGSFLVSSNSYSWSHNNTDQHIKTISFGKWNQGDVIDVCLQAQKLRFRNRRLKRTHTLKVKISDAEWKSVCFCVNLCTVNDEIKIAKYKAF